MCFICSALHLFTLEDTLVRSGRTLHLEISNTLGQIVYQSSQLINGLNPVDLTEVGSGLYYGKVTYRDSKTKSFKLIKL